MARSVFFSFKYQDVSRAMVVRNSWVTQGKEAAGFIDSADFEKIKQQGDAAIKNWINKQLDGTSVTVVLVGEKTCGSRWVKYEINKSIERGNGLLGIDISKIKDLKGILLRDAAKFLWDTILTFGIMMMVTIKWVTGLK